MNKLHEDEKEIRGIIVDPETGEIIDQINAGDSIMRLESKKIDEKYQRNFNKGESFLKIYDSVMPDLLKYLTKTEFSCSMLLLPYISYEDCILKKNNGSVINLKDIPEMFDLSYDRSRKIIKSLINKGVIGIFETGYKENPNKKFKCYAFNPFIASKGTTINKTVVTMFSESQWICKELSVE